MCSLVDAPPTESPAAALERAKADARKRAVEAMGVSVKSGCVDLETLRGQTSALVVQCMVATGARGIVSRELVVGEGMKPTPGGGFQRWVRLRVHVIEWAPQARDAFRARMSIGGKSVFRSGEHLRVEVHASEASTLFLLNVAESGTTLLLPNEWVPEARVAGGSVFVFPSDRLRNRGVELVVEAPNGRTRSRETLLLVALKDGRTLPEVHTCPGFCRGEASDGGRAVSDMLAPLAALPADEWTFAQVAYEVLQ